MAEKTDVMSAVKTAIPTLMCGFGSDGAAALLSACSFFRCCSQYDASNLAAALLQDLSTCAPSVFFRICYEISL